MRGKQDINIHLLKPARFLPDPKFVIPPSLSNNVVQNEDLAPGQAYVAYAYRTAHPVLRWLPTKLAEWIGSNLCEELGIPPKRGSLWTASELNAIIIGNIVCGPHGHLHTFGTIQWECELFHGRPKARCYPFDINGHRFRNKNPKVCRISDPISYLISYPISYTIFNMLFCFQDCVCLVAPLPFRSEPLDEFNVSRDFDITGAGEVWYARPQLFFRCTLCPTGAMGDSRTYKEFSLVFFNTFEPISLTPDSCLQLKGVPMLYERSATVLPSLYVCPVQNVLGRVPLIPCYLNGNDSNTIPYKYRGAIPAEAAADSRHNSGTGSKLFEINIWMWRYGRTFPRDVSVADAVAMRKQRVQESRQRAAATMQRRRAQAVARTAGTH